jgi:hypothetical protein
MPADPRPRAPLAVMDDEKLADAQDLASQATDEVDTFAVQIALCDALVELDAQRRAHATAYAEGVRDGRMEMLEKTTYRGALVTPTGPYVLVADLQAIFYQRDTPAPRPATGEEIPTDE